MVANADSRTSAVKPTMVAALCGSCASRQNQGCCCSKSQCKNIPHLISPCLRRAKLEINNPFRQVAINVPIFPIGL